MSVVSLMQRLREAGVQLWLEEGKLKFRAPAGALTPELRAAVGASKPEIVRFLEQAAAGAAGPPPILPVPRDRPLPLSFAQQRLWFIEQLTPDTSVFNMPNPLRLEGELDPRVLAHALAEVRNRHESLRTSFQADTEGEPFQVIAPPVAGRAVAELLPCVDLSGLAQEPAQATVRRLVVRMVRWPFVLSRPPLARSWLVRLAPEDHVLTVTLHHAISDGWSMGVVVRELAAIYTALAAGRPNPLPPLAIQVPDFAAWQRDWLSGETLERLLSYWRGQLATAPKVLELPADRSRPAVQSFAGRQQGLRIPAATATALNRLAGEHEASLFMVLLAAFQLLLARASGQWDLVVGSPIANRNREEIEPLIGFFVNTLPLRATIDPRAGFAALLAQVRDTTLAAYEHQDLPFERIVEELVAERDLSRQPLCQVNFALQNVPAVALELPGLRLSAMPGQRVQAQMDWVLSLAETPAGLTGWLEYATDLFDSTTVHRWLRSLMALLGEIVAEPARPVAELRLLTPAQRHQLQSEWNAAPELAPELAGPTAVGLTTVEGGERESTHPLGSDLAAAAFLEAPIHLWVAAHARQRPDAAAVVDGDRHLTYGTLWRRSVRLAGLLREAGLERDLPVALLLKRSPELVTAMVAVLAASGSYLPIDPEYPDARVAFMLRDSSTRLLVTDAAGAGRYAERLGAGAVDGLAVVRADLTPPGTGAPEGEPATPALDLAPEQLAYVIYTSGSTGQPKGVQIAHRGLSSLIAWWRQTHGYRPGERATMTGSPAFDGSVIELWPALSAGATIELPPADLRGEGEGLAAWMVERRISLSMLSTAMAEPLLSQHWPASAALRRLNTGGDRLRLRSPAGVPFELHNNYGPTEVTVMASASRVGADAAGTGGGSAPPSIGRPITGQQIHLFERVAGRAFPVDAAPAPIGVPGELWIAGCGLARGYRARPGLTAERFLPHPQAADAGARIYRSGDLARRLADGRLEFLGRIDGQVKLRGYRIELGEIEAQLAGHPAVEAAAALLYELSAEDQRLIAYYVPQAEFAQGAEEEQGAEAGERLRSYLAERLPAYMVPSLFVALEALPVTAHGKLDRTALPLPEGVRSQLGGEYLTPRTPREERLAAIFAEVLSLDRVGVHDNFFALGGHSLLATRVISRLRRAFETEVSLRTLFSDPTVAGLAAAIDRRRGSAGAVAPPLVPRGAELADRAPASYAQQRLWFIEQLRPGSHAYHMPMSLRLEGRLDVPALARVLSAIEARHEALRTTFAADAAGEPVQVIVPATAGRLRSSRDLATLRCVDLSGLPAAAVERVAGLVTLQVAQRPFDLARGPLWRTWLLRMSPDDHLLAATFHHIISDGWSIGVAVQELTALYGAAIRTEAAGTVEELQGELPPLEIQYPDFALWQRQWLSGETLERFMDHWREQLAGASRVLELPTDRPRPPVQSFRGRVQGLNLGLELSERLGELARREGASLFMLLLAGFQLLLSRYSGQDDLLVGTPIANRNRAEIEPLIGFFINTLALRARIHDGDEFRSLLQQVRGTTLDAFDHQDLPFERIVEEVVTERDLSRQPLCQVLFNLQNAPQGALELGELSIQPVHAERVTAQVDWSLTLIETPEGIGGGLVYGSDLFDATTMRRAARHYRCLLEAIVADPQRRLGELSYLSAAERHQSVAEWNHWHRDRSTAAGAGTPGAGTVHALFEAQARATPEAVAAVFEGEQIRFGELEARANRLARRLRALGVRTDDAVGLMMERSLDLVTAVLAILKAGAGYLPLDPGYPSERLAFMVEDAGMPVLLTSGALADDLPPTGARLLRLDAEAAAIAAESAESLELPVSPEGLCYAIFTSGSTGRPKGTLVTHRAVHNRMLWFQEQYRLQPDDRVLQKTPISFDVSVWELFWPLTAGATIVLARPGGHMDAPYLLELLIAAGITTLHFVPSMLRVFLAQPGLERLRQEGRVRRVVASGEALTIDLQEAFFESFGCEMPLHNMYGPSEAARASFEPVDPDGDRGVVPIGRPVVNDYIYQLDSRLRPVGIGVPAELAIGGIGVARGYHQRPDLTAEKFLPDPYAGVAGARLYRTGDLTRFLPDGRIEFLGRIDNQLKVRGMRVELGEIDAALERHPQVREAAVVARDLAADDRRLVAYLVPVDVAPSASQLRRFLADRLPEYMLPAHFELLERMPLTPSGKVDRRALPQLRSDRLAGDGDFVAPRSPIETALADIFGQVLGVERVGIHDSFFELGGHSLLATQVVARVRAVLGVEAPLRGLFEAPTVAAWAPVVWESRRAGHDLKVPPLVRVPRTPGTELPLSFAQQRLWFLDQLVPGNPFYNMYYGFRLRGAVSLGIIGRCFAEIVRRHEVLRTVFPAVEGKPAQRILTPEQVRPLRVVDLRGLPEAIARRLQERLSAADAQRPFDLARGPLLRATAVALADEEQVLQMNIHHIVSDGWSMGVLYRELFALYAAISRGEPTRQVLPELVIQYADFSRWQVEILAGEMLERQLGFWRSHLDAAPQDLQLPFDRPRPEIESFQGAWATIGFDRQASDRIMAFARHRGATPFMVLMAAFKALVYRFSGQTDMVVGTGIANRTHEELEGLIGFFVNTLALRTRLEGVGNFEELVGRVRDTALDAYSHQDLPFERLVEELKIERSLSRNPLCQALLVVQNYPLQYDGEPVAGVAVEPIGEASIETGSAKFDLTVYLHESGGPLNGVMEFNTDLFDTSTVQRFAQTFVRLAAALVTTPEVRLESVPLLAAGERRQIVEEWGSRPAEYHREAAISELFEAQASARPAAVALRWGDETLSYDQLNRAANRLAHRLIELGVGGEERVGIALARSPELVVSILAVLKAGGVYVPLDLSYPADRLASMLDSTGVELLLVAPQAEAMLPRSAARVVTVTADMAGVAEQSEDNPPARAAAQSLAYIVFTSGSTGTPRGVAVPHRAVARLVQNNDFASFGPDEVFLMLAPVSFDASTFELWGPLLNGGELVIFPPHKPTLEELGETIERAGVTTLWLTSGLFHQMVEGQGSRLTGVRQILAGGDVVSPIQVRKMLAAAGDAGMTVINGYGPTENTTFTCCYPMRSLADVRAPVPIGRPIANSGVLILDSILEPLPLGAHGDLYASGDGLARGYFGDPALTAERFVPHPFPARPGERMYATGDRATWLADGCVQFLGRRDTQVKVRGFRIELEEIESRLRSHPGVRDAAVMARREGAAPDSPVADGGASDGAKRLVAYVVQDPDYQPEVTSDGAVEGEQVGEWEMVFDDLYRKDSADDDPTFNIIGWESTYTGQPLPAQEMRDWLDDTVARIRSLRPERVLEIGVGTGMLLFRIAPDCERYVGTDLSEEAIRYLERTIGDRLPQVELAARAADVFDGIAPGSFDTVILNSVVQYFPTAEYLAKVIDGALTALAPGGALFLGDLRSQPLLAAFAADVELFQADDDLPLDALRLRVQRRLLQENELAVAPAFFRLLAAERQGAGAPPIDRVEVFPKRGRPHNELTAFRYQVVLRAGGGEPPDPLQSPLVWRDAVSQPCELESLRALLGERPATLAVRNLPNARTLRGATGVELLAQAGAGQESIATTGALRARLQQRLAAAIDPHQLELLAAELGYELELGAASPGDDGRFDAVLRRSDLDGPPLASLLPQPALPRAQRSLADLCSRPLQGRFIRQAVPALRRYLQESLPDYMVPSAFVLLDELPLNANGKVDRRALPAPDAGRSATERPYVAPRTPTEEMLAEVWGEVLGVGQVGALDSFFELGGHSLLATQVVSRVRERVGFDLPLRTLFELQLLSELAQYLDAVSWAGGQARPEAAVDAESEVVDAAVGSAVVEEPGELVEEWEL